jgi:hypothetical protein
MGPAGIDFRPIEYGRKFFGKIHQPRRWPLAFTDTAA